MGLSGWITEKANLDNDDNTDDIDDEDDTDDEDDEDEEDDCWVTSEYMETLKPRKSFEMHSVGMAIRNGLIPELREKCRRKDIFMEVLDAATLDLTPEEQEIVLGPKHHTDVLYRCFHRRQWNNNFRCPEQSVMFMCE